MLSTRDLVTDLLLIYSKQELAEVVGVHLATVYRILHNDNVQMLGTYEKFKFLHDLNKRKISAKKRHIGK